MFKETEKQKAFRELNALEEMREVYTNNRVLGATELDVMRYKLYTNQCIKELKRKIQVLTENDRRKVA